jgi:hypothetical protein
MEEEHFRAVAAWELTPLMGGIVTLVLDHAGSPEEFAEGRTQSLRLSLTIEQSRALAEDLRRTAEIAKPTPTEEKSE